MYGTKATRLGASVYVDQGKPYNFTCEVQGTRPAVTIAWFLNDTVQHITNPPPESDDGLSNSSSTWTFVPSRESHRQVVKCVASNTGSQRPFPFVMTTLDVRGKPIALYQAAFQVINSARVHGI